MYSPVPIQKNRFSPDPVQSNRDERTVKSLVRVQSWSEKNESDPVLFRNFWKSSGRTSIRSWSTHI